VPFVLLPIRAFYGVFGETLFPGSANGSVLSADLVVPKKGQDPVDGYAVLDQIKKAMQAAASGTATQAGADCEGAGDR
jgi:hypothetical protein